MATGDIDYIYSKQLLERINTVYRNDQSLREYFVLDAFNLWQSYQQPMFQEIKQFSRTKKFVTLSTPMMTRLKNVVLVSFLFVISVVAMIKLKIKRNCIPLYAIDRINSKYRSDFRMTALYDVLTETKQSYIEVIHTIVRGQTISNLFKRRRLAIYLESLDWLSFFLFRDRAQCRQIRAYIDMIDLTEFSEEERTFVRFILQQFATSRTYSMARVRILSGVIAGLHSKLAFGIDDARSYHEFVIACRKSAVTMYALQHGHFTKYHVGWLQANLGYQTATPHYILVWSDYWRNELMRLHSVFTADQIIIGGLPKPVTMQTRATSDQRHIGVLIPFETDAAKREVKVYLEALVQCEGITLMFKVRPDIPAEEQFMQYAISDLADQIEIVKEPREYLDRTDIVIGTYSTFLYDMIAEGKCVALFATTIDMGYGLVENDLAELISSPSSVCAEVQQLAKTSEKIRAERARALCGDTPQNLRESLLQILNTEQHHAGTR